MNLIEAWHYLDWIHVAQDRDQWNTALNLWVLKILIISSIG
jgi:hypothetical protein